MNTVHAIVIDKQRRLYVSDSANHRVQIFDENGKFLEDWRDVPLPYSFLMSEDEHLWSARGQTQKFTKYDLNGRLLAAWGTFGAIPAASGGFTSSMWTTRATSTPPMCMSDGRRSLVPARAPTATA